MSWLRSWTDLELQFQCVHHLGVTIIRALTTMPVAERVYKSMTRESIHGDSNPDPLRAT